MKQFTAGTSAGAAALFVIFAILLPSINDNADAIIDLRVSEGIILTTLENQGDKLDGIDEKLDNANVKLNKIMILLCQNSESVLCN
jgi:hypothetical protein